MTEPKFTPGPWRFVDDGECSIDTPGDNTCRFIGKNSLPFAASFQHSAFGKDDICDANAHLIAAAPELYEALDRFVDWMNEEEGAHSLCDSARAALAKARGEQ